MNRLIESIELLIKKAKGRTEEYKNDRFDYSVIYGNEQYIKGLESALSLIKLTESHNEFMKEYKL